jgi:hypothetical protein
MRHYISHLEDRLHSITNKINNRKEINVDDNFEKNKIMNTLKTLKVK